MTRRNLAWPSARSLCLISTLALGSVVWLSPAKAQEAKPAVVVAPATTMDLRATNNFTGRLVAIQRIDIRARVSGFLETIDFTEGGSVKAGDVLYTIEPGAYQASVDEIQGSLQATSADLKLAQIQRDRQSQLVQKGAAAQTELDKAEAQLAKAQGENDRLKGTLERAELELSYTKIMAPFDGVVGLTTVDIGALVGPDSGPLTTLTRLDTIRAEFPVSTGIYMAFRERVKNGQASDKQTVTLTLPDGSVYPQKGDIDFVDSSVRSGTDTIMVRASFANPEGVLPNNALVGVSLESDQPELVLAIPQQAVQRDQSGAFVMVVGADSRVAIRRVDVARTTKGFAVITDGLKEGEQVITEGVNKVRPGIVVDAATSDS